MRIGDVIGTVTLTRCHPTLVGARWLIAVPHSFKTLKLGSPPDGEDLVIYDDLGAGLGGGIAFSEGGEAAAPFHPKKVPVDAYCAAILDQLTLR